MTRKSTSSSKPASRKSAAPAKTARKRVRVSIPEPINKPILAAEFTQPDASPIIDAEDHYEATGEVIPSPRPMIDEPSAEGNAEPSAETSEDATSAQTSETPPTSDESNASSDDSADSSEPSIAPDELLPSLDDIASADEAADKQQADKQAAKQKPKSPPKPLRREQQLHRALTGLDNSWTNRLLYSSKRRMKMDPSIDLSHFPEAFVWPVKHEPAVFDAMSDEQRAEYSAQEQRARVWDAAMLTAITYSAYLMPNQTPAITAFLTEMGWDASDTRTAPSVNKKVRTSTPRAPKAPAVDVDVIAGEAMAEGMVISTSAKRALASLTKSREKLDSAAPDFASKSRKLDAAIAFASARLEAERAAKEVA